MATRQSDFWTERAPPRIDPARLGGILAAAADLTLIVGTDGVLLSVTVNPDSGALGHLDHWEGRDIRAFLAPDSVDKVMRQIAAVAGHASNVAAAIEVNHVDGAEWDAPVRYTLHPMEGDGTVLMLGRDLRPVTELQQRLIRAQVALERDREAQRVHETRFRVLMEATADAVVLIDVASGRVVEANDRAAAMVGADADAIRGASLAQEFEGRRRVELIDALCAAGAPGVEDGAVDVVTARGGRALSLHPRLFRGGGERTLLVRLVEDGAGTAAADGRSARLEGLFERVTDAIAFADGDGSLVGANDAFLAYADLDGAAGLRGRALADFLGRGAVDMRVLTDGPGLRRHATHLVSAYGTRVAVEVASCPLPGGGHGFVLREAEAGDGPAAASGAGRAPTVDAGALVGTAALRDIVASTTDAIEKECIEAAIAYTANNRVAAAEMLGLSRQSLYVKLRKYGLLDRGDD